MFVSLRDGETQEALLKRFQRSVQNSGLLREVKAKRFFISNGEKAAHRRPQVGGAAPAPGAQGGRPGVRHRPAAAGHRSRCGAAVRK